MDRIDAHQHFWRTDRGDYPWMDGAEAALRRDFLPSDLAMHLTDHAISGTIAVQAAPTEDETRFLLAICDDAPFIRGVVGWLDLEAPDFAERLDALATDTRLKGLRPMLQDIKDTDWIARPAVIAALKIMAARGLCLDALIQPRHLTVLAQVAAQVPDLTIVIDHCAKPEIADGTAPGDDWYAGMTALAALPQVVCKLSGLATEAGKGWTADALRPVAAHVLGAFGPDRVIWGSDWPMLEPVGTYQAWVTATDSFLSDLTAEEREAVLGGTATRVYDLPA